jgi:hypothetical protein
MVNVAIMFEGWSRYYLLVWDSLGSSIDILFTPGLVFP